MSTQSDIVAEQAISNFNLPDKGVTTGWVAGGDGIGAAAGAATIDDTNPLGSITADTRSCTGDAAHGYLSPAFTITDQVNVPGGGGGIDYINSLSSISLEDSGSDPGDRAQTGLADNALNDGDADDMQWGNSK
jgi:hypothetical protein